MNAFDQAMPIIEVLNDRGFEAYFVGGAVRDKLRGIPAHDIDIATNARPQQVLEIANSKKWKALTVGINFGVVKIVIGENVFEAATFRTETYDGTSHQPSKVWFKSSLEDDLSRRDFTINAIAMDRYGKIIDPFNGVKDIQAGIIRCVGDPNNRFQEDALRMFRAIRFVAQLGYILEERTYQAIIDNKEQAKVLSVERVIAEIEKTLLAKFAATGIMEFIQTGLFLQYCRVQANKQLLGIPILPEVVSWADCQSKKSFAQRFHQIEMMPEDLRMRWAALLIGLEVAVAGKLLSRLRIKKTVIRRVEWLLQYSQKFLDADWLKYVQFQAGNFSDKVQLGEALTQLFSLHDVQLKYSEQESQIAKQKVHRKQIMDFLDRLPVYIDELNISGKVVADRLGKGSQVKLFLQAVLVKVQEERIANTEQDLRQELNEWTDPAYSRR